MKRKLIFVLICFFFLSSLQGQKHKRVELAFSPLALLSTSPNGGYILFEKGDFYLNPKIERILYYSAREGVTIMRVLSYAQWWIKNKNQMFTPFFYDREAKKWDLTKWSKSYWREVKRFIEVANRYGIKVMFCIFDSCGFHRGEDTARWRKFNPFINNIQGIVHFIYDYEISLRYVRKCLDEFKEYDMMYEFCNEFCCEGGKQEMVRFAMEVFKIFKEYGISTRQLTYGAKLQKPYERNLQRELKASRNIGQIYGEKAKTEIYFPVHCAVYCDCLARAYGYFWPSFFISDDGDYRYIEPGCDFIPSRPDRWRPRKEELYIVIKTSLEKYKWHAGGRLIFEHCPKSLDKSCQKPKLRAMVKAYYEYFGTYPENYHKHKFKGYLTKKPKPDTEDSTIEPLVKDPIKEPIEEPEKPILTLGGIIAGIIALIIIIIFIISKQIKKNK